ncbi:hypothetical protein [Aquimarina algiphila]|uniref:hypothetical protein n=1 Tax=Aquimarina algiphila TaxID=2047982 RepID=UPI00232F8104|nr:hypothetical protein [Aquimarina algiphila]
MNKTEKVILKIGIGLILFMVVGLPLIFGGDEGSNTKANDFNVQNKETVLSYLQGKWQGEVHSGNKNTNIHYRLLIEGNTMTVYTKLGFNQWNMSNPKSIHAFSISSISRTSLGNIRRFVMVDKPTLAVESFTPLEVNEWGFFHVDHALFKGWK